MGFDVLICAVGKEFAKRGLDIYIATWYKPYKSKYIGIAWHILALRYMVAKSRIIPLLSMLRFYMFVDYMAKIV